MGITVIEADCFCNLSYSLEEYLRTLWRPGARPTNDISIEFESQPKFVVLWFKMYSTNHNEILYMSRQSNCRDVCKISLWSVEHILK